MSTHYTATMERGKVVDEQMRVKSLFRKGIITRPLSVVPGLELAVGDSVYFFVFDDGTGCIVAKYT